MRSASVNEKVWFISPAACPGKEGPRLVLGFNAIYSVHGYIHPILSARRPVSLDSLEALYARENSIKAKYALAFLYLDSGDLQAGQSVMDDIPGQFQPDGPSMAEYQAMSVFYGYLRTLISEGKSIHESDSAQIATLSGICSSASGLAGFYAMNVLLALNELSYDEPVILPGILKSSPVNQPGFNHAGNSPESDVSLKVMPNPAKDFIMVEYELNRDGEALLQVLDATGLTKYSHKPSGRSDVMVVSTSGWKPGVYIAVLKLNGNIMESKKFVINE
ncbi:MAG: T9SS type A sorting domain-containing protein [Bacteroidales bacterium]|nr:T9SS type A sorting domain-containing protein [Bacteroidales bacterium]